MRLLYGHFQRAKPSELFGDCFIDSLTVTFSSNAYQSNSITRIVKHTSARKVNLERWR